MELIVKDIIKLKDDPFLCVFTTTKKIKGVLLGPLAVIMYKALRRGDIVQAEGKLVENYLVIKKMLLPEEAYAGRIINITKA